eukprot:363717-Chlamydomonas_euryale.AAC.7
MGQALHFAIDRPECGTQAPVFPCDAWSGHAPRLCRCANLPSNQPHLAGMDVWTAWSNSVESAITNFLHQWDSFINVAAFIYKCASVGGYGHPPICCGDETRSDLDA